MEKVKKGKGHYIRLLLILLVPLGTTLPFLIIGALAWGAYSYYKFASSDTAIEVTPNAEETKLTVAVNKVIDGDQRTDIPFIENKRIIKITLEFTNDNSFGYTFDPNNFYLKFSDSSHAKVEKPTSIEIGPNSSEKHSFYFQVDNKLNPESIEIVDNQLSSHINLEINTSAEYYTKDPDTRIVANDYLNEEYKVIRGKINDYLKDPTRLKPNKLNEFSLQISLPDEGSAEFYKSEKIQGGEHEGYYEVPEDCLKLDKTTLTPTREEIYCEQYSIQYSIFSSTRLTSISGYFDIYLNSYPVELTDIVSPSSTYKETPVKIFGQDAVIKEISDGSNTYRMIVTKNQRGDAVLIKLGNPYYSGQDVLPEEIATLKGHLDIQILGTLQGL